MKHASLRLAVVGALAALALAGCGGASKTSQTKPPTTNRPATNGLEHQSAAQVLHAAIAALKSAKSVRMTGTGVGDQGKPMQVDLRFQGRSGSATMEQQGAKLMVITVGDDTWMKGDQGAWKQMGAPAEALRRLAGRWVKTTPRHAGLAGFSLNSFTAAPAMTDRLLVPGVGQTMLDGKQVVVISEHDGAKLYVANTGPAYLLRAEKNKGKDAGRFDFTEYGADFHITAPATSSTSTRSASLRLPGDAQARAQASALACAVSTDARPSSGG
jgi:hypothetical protein